MKMFPCTYHVVLISLIMLFFHIESVYCNKLLRGATEQEKGTRRQDTQSNDFSEAISNVGNFPKVFTAIIKVPTQSSNEKHENQDYSAQFMQEVDFLGVIDRLSLQTDEFAKISFIVHSQKELNRLIKNSEKSLPDDKRLVSSLSVDVRKTEKLHQEAKKNVNEINGRSVQEQTAYASIANFPCYRNLEGVKDTIHDLAARNVTNLKVTLEDIGDSYLKTQNSAEGHDITVIKITGNGVTAPRTTEKGTVFAMFGLHAREYAPPELGVRWAEMLVNGYGKDAEITSILDHTEIHLLLHANPDGRYVAETNRFAYKRKNMNPSNLCGNGDEIGVDLNRNFPFMWGLDNGSSSNPCSSTYRGPHPASEPEVEAIVNYTSSIFPESQRKNDPLGANINDAYHETTKGVFFDIHSYGELNLWPWGWQNKKSANDEDLQTIGRKFSFYNKHILAGPEFPDFLYTASGDASDWAYGELGAAAFVFELGTWYYQMCSTFESSIVPDNIHAFMYAAKISRAPYSIPKGPDVTSIDLSSTYVPNNTSDSWTVTAQVSDGMLSSGYTTGQQTITAAYLFIDEHPYDENPSPTGILMIGNYNSGSDTVTLTIDAETLLSYGVGKHILHIQAKDSDNYYGPVTSMYFYTCDPLDTDCLTGYKTPSPTPSPTLPVLPCRWELKLKTDRYGSETSWNLASLGTEVASGSRYGNGQDLNHVEECLSPGFYTFTIIDSYGDGICCQQGMGSYAIILGGNEIKRGGDFGAKDLVEFEVA